MEIPKNDRLKNLSVNDTSLAKINGGRKHPMCCSNSSQKASCSYKMFQLQASNIQMISPILFKTKIFPS